MSMSAGKLRMRGKWRWILGLSLALNLLVVGMMAGAAWRHAGGPQGPERSGSGSSAGFGAAYMRALPKPARDEMRAMLPPPPERNKEGFRAERRAGYQQVAELLRADPFDAEALRAALDGQRDLALARQSAVQEAWLAVLSEMEPEARADYADALLAEVERPRNSMKMKHK
ncbi:MAG: periplasmic heavy metal sensor [Sulfitobacter sp.]